MGRGLVDGVARVQGECRGLSGDGEEMQRKGTSCSGGGRE